ncbi:MAG TPA: 2,5-dihydroxypyridine 5,6-dioxygenase [Steroidobacteraceae bacterium]|jgi:2,5-dihydroxypyridine 5,6-dioxygenase
MAISDLDLFNAWVRVLELCQLKSREAVTILTNANTHPQTLMTAAMAVQSLGAKLNRLDLPVLNGEKALSRDPFAYLGATPLKDNPPAMAALKASDLVLDLMLLLFSPEQQEILSAGTRILLAVEPPEILTRLIPIEQDKLDVLAAAAKLERGKELRITSAAGTDLKCPLGQFDILKEYGFVDEPGRWDHWPSGFLATWPNEGQVQGTVVLNRGDILLPMKSFIREPIALKIENGFLISINGGLEADILREYMESFNDPEAYAVSHLGWGLQKRAKWSMLELYDREAAFGMDARAFAGNFLFSFGPNVEAGGSRNTACHIDIPMRHCTVQLDGETVVNRGHLT